MTRVNVLLDIARSRTPAPHTPVATQPEYIGLPDDDSGDFYTVDNTPTPFDTSSSSDLCCPDTLDAMLQIVRELRRARYLATHALPDDLTPAQEERAVVKNRVNNLVKTNLSDYYTFT